MGKDSDTNNGEDYSSLLLPSLGCKHTVLLSADPQCRTEQTHSVCSIGCPTTLQSVSWLCFEALALTSAVVLGEHPNEEEGLAGSCPLLLATVCIVICTAAGIPHCALAWRLEALSGTVHITIVHALSCRCCVRSQAVQKLRLCRAPRAQGKQAGLCLVASCSNCQGLQPAKWHAQPCRARLCVVTV